MNNLITNDFNNFTLDKTTVDNIEDIQDLSDNFIKRLRLTFKNGYGISIVYGSGTYGATQGLFEIAPLNKQDNIDGSIIGLNDDVEGYLTYDDVIDRIKQIINIED